MTRLLPGQQPRSPRASGWRPTNAQKGEGMADLIFVALTIAVFVVLGLVLKAVERL